MAGYFNTNLSQGLLGSSPQQGLLDENGNYINTAGGYGAQDNPLQVNQAPAQSTFQNTASTISSALTGVEGIANIYTGLKGLGLAEDSLKLQQQAYKTNLANQTASYNTNAADTVNGRSANADVSQAEKDKIIAARQL